MYVKPKKELGQHFLKDLSIAQRIAELLTGHGEYKKVLEIGPGMGVLTQFILQDTRFETYVIEIDRESVDYLKLNFPVLEGHILPADFLNIRPDLLPTKQPDSTESFAIIGNFPYNISTQILFKVLDMRDRVPEVVGMFQREVAQRVASGPGNKDYGILSVLLQAWYDIKYEFTVDPTVFNPPPKVFSGVLSLRRNATTDLGCDVRKFTQVVKHGFSQRRKTLRNALKPLNPPEAALASPFMDKRAEQLSVAQFVELTKLMTEEREERE
ncbi:16S rRNA (adenine(1518)-N(6)/adenine(1519)-N(6))-dimethyltransferase RsmA [Spirosoma sp. KCTC 42546]|uniref:16S rRNA (adenine(1518)-N(6)/adenine(1519)-N(6))- dimethyltransferase RsmA n=1 Tax=Spirosoma sp. KCTC 42546 TaxID=2520506 RepID=UPI001158CF3B|nr:16S rRNA (adenine(1518)-N(6)/adenine(1519)-N(6))-dimethyltransferase RsmA [Spirosoma sp. KCTC 42546]QDK81721.1 16S rRNA (adenine(1518)-N(6)/adenine(1519)-N(6))-dimethyltransferase RsmA [Spirosoma sp. KCTC 42546]